MADSFIVARPVAVLVPRAVALSALNRVSLPSHQPWSARILALVPIHLIQTATAPVPSSFPPSLDAVAVPIQVHIVQRTPHVLCADDLVLWLQRCEEDVLSCPLAQTLLHSSSLSSVPTTPIAERQREIHAPLLPGTRTMYSTSSFRGRSPPSCSGAGLAASAVSRFSDRASTTMTEHVVVVRAGLVVS